MKQLLPIVVVCIVVVVCMGECDAIPSPIVLFPGVMGSRLEVKDSKPRSLCSTRNSYKKLWVDPIRLTIFNVCAKRELSLKYDAATNSFNNNTNVKMLVPDFGGTSAIEYLTTGLLDLVPYFHDMVEYFIKRGYIRGKSIRGAPYDWRLAADELEKRGYFHRLKDLVEDTYQRNGNTKVTLVAHSMGGLVSLHFLTGFNGVNQAWKDKYIHAYIPLSAAWNGGVASLQAVISGKSIGGFFAFANGLINKFLVPIGRTLESIPWLTPKPSVFGNKVLISTPSRQYTANDYEELFGKIGYTNGYRFFQGVQRLVQNYPNPNVQTYCYYGTDVPTPSKFIYTKDFRRGVSTIGLTPEVVNGDGDGTVNIESSMVCHRWSGVVVKPFSGVNHKGIVTNKAVLDSIASIVRAPPPAKKKTWSWKKRA